VSLIIEIIYQGPPEVAFEGRLGLPPHAWWTFEQVTRPDGGFGIFSRFL
jgi:hypothetical protein